MEYINLNKTNKNKIVLKKKLKYRIVFFNYNGKVEVIIENSGIELEIWGLYVASENNKYNLDIIQHHKEAGSKSQLLVRGVFADQSIFDYSATVKIDNNASNTKASQKNKNILLSDEVEINTKPYLEIDNDKVECSHASTSGGLDEKELYYLQTRGLSKAQAKQILLRGFVQEIKDKFLEEDKLPDFNFYSSTSIT